MLLLQILLLTLLQVPGIGQLFGAVVMWVFPLLSLYRDFLEGGHFLILGFWFLIVLVVIPMGLV